MSTIPVSSVSFSSSASPLVLDDKLSTKQDVVRHTMNFSASIWGDQFLTYHEPEDLVIKKQQVEQLKEEVKKELMAIKGSNDPQQHIKLMELIDSVQRLGIAYHFEEEIEEALQHIHVTYGEHWVDKENLQSVSLWFRLLRQQGFNVSSGVFKDYMDEKGNFKESLCNDAQGILALYEAAYMRVEGETRLDKALEFTKVHLDIISKDPSCDSYLRTRVHQALKQPLRRRLARIEALHYMPVYQQDSSHNEVLLKLAKVDFSVLQSMHKKELSHICKWWKDLDLQNKLPYVRDRVVEGYFWILSIYYEPQHARTRMFLMKTCMWLVVLDDTFDNYGTYEELEIFAQAVERWSISCMDMLPEYMKLIYQELVNLHVDMEESLEKEGKTYQIHYVKEMAKELVRNYLVEARWLKEGYMPTLEEYMSVSMVTGTYGLMIARSYVGRDDIVTEDTFKWVSSYPPIIKASCVIVRLMDDIVSHKEEQERGHVASSIECYSKESGATEEEACEYISSKVEDAWKVINRESLRPTAVPFPLLMPAINLARMCEVLYSVNDGFTHAEGDMKSYMKSYFVHPMVI
uniref:Sesquiterpene synthase 6 n=1 Tax=Matricaria chamomilla var. recutita TaxID=127986 RepID=A0A075W2D6_MATCR|nr:sesquiterpene synthase 6 [Matricaria chamomilla var. recutita]